MAESPTTFSTAEEEPGARSDSPAPLEPAIVWGFPDPQRPIVWLGDSRHTIGRDDSCSIELRSKTLSRRHAELRPVGKLWLVEDLGSRNGVFVNGKRVERTALNPGDTLRVGEWLGTFTELVRNDALPFASRSDGLSFGPTLRPILARAELLAQSELPLVLEGETGTGKEVFARAVHAASGRTGRFVAVNCATYQRENAAAELFGYRRGAFTGAERNHEGHIQAANNGTLFLDEVGELLPEVQANLLRALQEGELLRLGETQPVRVNVRIVAATQRPLAIDVDLGRFRADLRARLEGAVITLPPLRQRREDVVPLFMTLLGRELGRPVETMDVRLLEYLAGYSWPLNTRELVLLVRKLAVLHRAGSAWSLAALKRELPHEPPRAAPKVELEGVAQGIRSRLVNQEAQVLVEALQRNGGNVSRTAAELKMSRQHAYRLLKSSRARDD
jgi:transcriptional regulator with PAS, ATPase and Fis domain